MNEDLTLWIQQDVDGILPDTDRRRLYAALGSDPEAAALHADLIRMAGALRALPAPAVPDRFTQRVMERIPVAARVAPTVRPAWLIAIRSAFAPRTAFAFALGCLLTIVAFGALDLAGMEETERAAGSMVQESAPSNPAGSIEIIPGAMSTRIALRFPAPVESIEIDLASDDPAVLDFQVTTSGQPTFQDTVTIGTPIR